MSEIQLPETFQKLGEVLEQGQVAGAGDGQELRHTLDQPQENRG